MLAIATFGIAGSEVWVGGRYLGISVTGLPRDEDQGTGSGNEGNGILEREERGPGTRKTGFGNEKNEAEDEDNVARKREKRGLRTRCVTNR
jgi:hypothetical protein